MSEEDLAIDYCAVTVAVVLIWHPERVPLGGGQWSAAKLSEEMRTLQYGEEVNLQVNPLALHQGLHIFKKFIRLLGHDLIQMGGKKGIPMIASFMGLAEVFNGLNIKFFVSQRREMEVENVNLLVQQMAYKLVKRHCGRELQFKSLSEIAAYIYQKSLPVERELDPGPEILVNKRRKMSTQLGPRQMSNCGKEIVNYVIQNLCVKDEEATPYIIAALKDSRTLTSLDTISRSIFGVACRNESDSVLDFISDHVRVKESLLLLPKRNIIFTDEEKEHVLRIFDVIESIIHQLPDENEIKTKYTTAEVTKKILENHPVYSELVANNIDRWHEVRDMIKKKPGRKINQEFEAAVWSKMMICEFEKIMVIIQLCCIIYVSIKLCI
jgi:hypothetical protein